MQDRKAGIQRRLAIISFIIVLFMHVLGYADDLSPQSIEKIGDAAAFSKFKGAARINGGALQLIIELNEPSVIESMRAAELTSGAAVSHIANSRRLNLQSVEARQSVTRVAESQKPVIEKLRALKNIEVQGSVHLILNAVFVNASSKQIEAIKKLTGVKRVSISYKQYPTLDAAASLHNAQAAWNAAGGSAGAGKGVKIGIIDTGIDINNEMFKDDSLVPPSGYPKGESAFTNKKVIVARNYLRFLNPQPIQTAIDEVGHGSFVAGCAAGKATNAPLATISGMAPGAFLGNYKIFGTPGINDGTPTTAVIAALDEAVADGMDVVNLSIGALSYIPPSDDPQIDAINRAVAAGVVVVVSAGNNGPNPKTIENPAVASEAISVGAVSNSRSLTSSGSTPIASGVLAIFSSRGPGYDFGIKPDLVAVGTNVYSAGQTQNPQGALYSSSGYLVSQGTSFSSPIVAGAAAVLKQLKPSLSPAGIRSALVSTANPSVVTLGTGNRSGVMQSGGGLLDMGKAVNVGAVFSPTSLSFGARTYTPGCVAKTLQINNISTVSDNYTLGIEPLSQGLLPSLSQTSTASIAPGGSSAVDVSICANSPITGGFQGFVTVQSSQTSSIYRIPYWAGIYVMDSSRILQLTSSGGVDKYTNLTDALRAARPGNVIEITDSGTYSSGLVIGYNGEGLPLHGITIRAAAGASPTLDGSASELVVYARSVEDWGFVNIQILGLQNVLLQGLNIYGSDISVFLTQLSEAPLSVTIDRCNVYNNYFGVEVDSGGSVNITKSTLSNSYFLALYAIGTQVTVMDSTVSNNDYFGIYVENSNLDVLNSTFSRNGYLGIGAFSSFGVIKGNTISDTYKSSSDGIDIDGGAFTISQNVISSSKRCAVGIWNSATTVSANSFRSNAQYGVLGSPLADGEISNNFFKENGSGVLLERGSTGLIANNIITNSTSTTVTSTFTPAGIRADKSNVRIVNNTIYGNQKYGVSLSQSTVSIANTIVAQNKAGDLNGVAASSVQYSLIGDSLIAAGNNITGDPKVTDPGYDNYNLATGSPAIDAGSNAVADLPFLDYDQRLRVRTAGAVIGDGIVDMGAIEAGATYPTLFPLLANGNIPALKDDYATGFALANSTDIPVQSNFTAFNSSGGILPGSNNPASESLIGKAQVARLGDQLFGLPSSTYQLGAVIADSTQKLTGFLIASDREYKRFMDGVDVSSKTATDLFFLRHQSDAAGKASYYVFNPGVVPASVSAKLYNSSGFQLDATKTELIPPKGQALFQFDNVTASSGFVQAHADHPVTGVEIGGNLNENYALRPAFPSTAGRLFFPHFAVNEGYSSLIGIVNMGNATAEIIFKGYDSNGKLLVPPVYRSLNSNTQILEDVASLLGLGSGSLISGYITAESSRGGIAGFTGFRYDNGTSQSAAAVPATSIPEKKLIFSQIAHQVAAGSGGNFLTGVALMNPFGMSINYTMKVYNGASNLVKEMSDTLAPYQKVAKLLSHPSAGGFFNEDFRLSNGHIEVTTDYGLLGFAMYFSEAMTELASVPGQTID